MQTMNLEKYKSLVPSETYDYVIKLLKYLNYNTSIDFGGHEKYIYAESDKVFFRSLKAFQLMEQGKALLSEIGFDDDHYLNENSSSLSDAFVQYYRYLAPFAKEEDYLVLTPEDIIKHICLMNDSDARTYKYMRVKPKTLINKLSQSSGDKTEQLLEQYENKYFTMCPIALVNYFKTVSMIYNYLDTRRMDIRNISPTDENLKAISYLLGLFYYKHVAYNQDLFDEQKTIIDYLAKVGITKEKIEEAIGVSVKDMNTYPSILTLKSKLDIDILNNMSDSNRTVTGVFNAILNSSYKENQSFKTLLGLLGVAGNDVFGLYEHVKSISEEYNSGAIEEIYKGLLPNVITLINRLIKTYTFLINYKNLDYTFVTSPNDYLALSLLISSYIDESDVSKYLTANNLPFDKVLELLHLPNKEELIKLINMQPVNQRIATKFKKLLFSGSTYSKSRNEITPELIYLNLTDKDYSSSEIVNKLYYSVNDEILPSDYKDRVKNYNNKTEEERLLEIKERLFKDIDINVYNYLVVVYAYYSNLKTKNLSPEDAKQLSIIYAACRFDDRLNKYLESIGVTRPQFSTFFNIHVDYEEKRMDVEELEREFGKYIFDRDPDKITVYSIFENAFVPELTNSVKLRQALHEMGKEPEDFFDIEKQMDEVDRKQREKEQQEEDAAKKEKIFKLNGKVGFLPVEGSAFNMNKDMLIIYDYLKNNVKDNQLLTSNDEIKQMAMLIVYLIPAHNCSHFFEEYGISLNYVLSLVGLTSSDLDEILKNKPNEESILDFAKYYEKFNTICPKNYAYFIFNVNGELIKKIISIVGEDYDKVKYAVMNEKERELSSREELVRLSSEEILPVDIDSLSSLSTYGDSLYRHQPIINGSLHKLVRSDAIDASVRTINEALDSVVVVERTEPRKLGFWESMFTLPEPVKETKRYDLSKVGTIQSSIDEQLNVLNSELAEYENIKKCLEVYLVKMAQQLEELQKAQTELAKTDKKPRTSGSSVLSDITATIELLNQNTGAGFLDSKIDTMKTTIAVMKHELLSVHRAINNHNLTINALQVSRNAILPALASEIAINKGIQSESSAIDLTGNILGVLQAVVNKNSTLAETNLKRIRSVSRTTPLLEGLDREVTQYLSDVDRKTALLEATKDEGLQSRKPIGMKVYPDSQENTWVDGYEEIIPPEGPSSHSL